MNPIGLRHRKRVNRLAFLVGETGIRTSAGSSITKYSRDIQTGEEMWDYESQWPNVQYLLHNHDHPAKLKRKLRRLDFGNEMILEKQVYRPLMTQFSKTSGLGSPIERWANAPIVGSGDANITPSNSKFRTLPTFDELVLWGLGSTAISRCAPGLPETSLSATVGELREGLPKLIFKIGTLREALNTGGSNYLGYHFGIKPLFSDIKDITKGIQKMDDTFARLEEESGNLLHRGFKFDTIDTTTLVSTTSNIFSWPQPASSVAPGAGVRNIWNIDTTETWFRGAFSFYFTQTRSALSELNAYLGQLGAAPTADTFWNLLPYSWLADWFGNFGDAIFNASYFHDFNRVMNYGYLMQHTTLTTRVEFTCPSGSSSEDFVSERKVRIKASPYGFGVKWESLSDYQLSILAALGVTRVT